MSSQDAPRGAGRITVNLTARSVKALKAAAEREELSKTDTVNRAIQMYDFWTARRVEGCEIALHFPDGEIRKVEMLG